MLLCLAQSSRHVRRDSGHLAAHDRCHHDDSRGSGKSLAITFNQLIESLLLSGLRAFLSEAMGAD